MSRTGEQQHSRSTRSPKEHLRRRGTEGIAKRKAPACGIRLACLDPGIHRLGVFEHASRRRGYTISAACLVQVVEAGLQRELREAMPMVTSRISAVSRVHDSNTELWASSLVIISRKVAPEAVGFCIT